MRLETILATHKRPAGLAGTGTASALERDLVRHVRWKALSYAALFVLLMLILVGVGITIALDVRDGRGLRTGVLAGAGVTFPIILEAIRRTVREWSRSDLLVVLSRRLDAAQLQVIIEQLVK